MIGVFDSGSGGLTILAALHRALPAHDFIYYGDHARAPYGHRRNDDIVAYTREGVDYLMRRGCTLVILACNTAAAVALRSLQQDWLDQAWPGRRILGVLVPMVEAVTGLPWHQETPDGKQAAARRVLLFATRKTVESGAYKEEIAKRAPHITLVQKACPGLVDAIEGGAGPKPLDGMVKGYVAEAQAMMDGPADAVVLGCTHFPLVEQAFRCALGTQTTVYAQPALVAESLGDYLARHPGLVPAGSGSVALLTTAEPDSLSDALPLDGLATGWQRA